VLYCVLREFGVPVKQIRLIKICLNETCFKVHVGKHLFDMFPIQNGIKKRCSVAITSQLCCRLFQ
jgi:hypothetical protein